MTLVRTNAVITKIAGGGTTKELGRAAGNDPEKWSGEEPANLVERLLTEVADGELDRVGIRYLDVPAALVDEVARGDRVTWQKDGEEAAADVRDIETDHVVLGFVRLHLEET